MGRFIVATLLLVASAAAAVHGRMVPSVFDDGKPRNSRELIGEDLCQKACDQVHYKAMCRSLTKLPDVTNPRQLLLASMRAAVAKAKAAKLRVDEYAATTEAAKRPPMASIVLSCRTGYDNVVSSLEDTRQFLEAPEGAHFNLNNELSNALTSASDCDNAFQDFPDVRSPFTAVQRNVYRLVSNVLNIGVVVESSLGLAQHPALPHGPHAALAHGPAL